MNSLLLAAVLGPLAFVGAVCLSRFLAARRRASALNAYALREIARAAPVARPASRRAR
jgi:hypothetical protein